MNSFSRSPFHLSFVCRGLGDPQCNAITVSGPLVSEGIVVLEGHRWHRIFKQALFMPFLNKFLLPKFRFSGNPLTLGATKHATNMRFLVLVVTFCTKKH